jgi:hypothetical protein
MRILGFVALVALAGGVSLLMTGFNESSRRAIEQQSGYQSIPADSAFMRSVLAAPLSDDLVEAKRASWLLTLAGRSTDADDLERFFSDCSARRVLGEDDACRHETVASAIDKGAASRGPTKPVGAPAALEARLADSVSFLLPDESLLRASASEDTWRQHVYDGPGVVRFQSSNGAYLFIAARNRSDWTIREIRAELTLRLPHGKSRNVRCDSQFLYPFFTATMAPGGTMLARCQTPDGVPLDDVVAAVRAMPPDAPAVQISELELKDPYATIVHHGVTARPRFTVAPLSFFNAVDRTINVSLAEVRQSLRDKDCHELGTCATAWQAFAMSASAPFIDQPVLIPPLLGVLLGIIVGGFVRRSFVVGSAFAGLLVLVAIGGIVYLFQSVSSQAGEKGFALMAVGALTFGIGTAFVMGLPTFFVTLVLMRALRARLAREPAPERSA